MNSADVLTAILYAKDNGEDPAIILDENSPLVGMAREVLKPKAPPKIVGFARAEHLEQDGYGYTFQVVSDLPMTGSEK